MGGDRMCSCLQMAQYRASRRDDTLCMCACDPGSCVQDTRLCRRRAGGDWTAAGGLPLVSNSGGSLRPRVPHRTGKRGDNCGRWCPGSKVLPHRPPHTDPGEEDAHLGTGYTGTQRDPNRKSRSCGRLCICCCRAGNAVLDIGKYISHGARRLPADSSCNWGCQGNRRHRTNRRRSIRLLDCRNQRHSQGHIPRL